jgi:hypothetical protein
MRRIDTMNQSRTWVTVVQSVVAGAIVVCSLCVARFRKPLP